MKYFNTRYYAELAVRADIMANNSAKLEHIMFEHICPKYNKQKGK